MKHSNYNPTVDALLAESKWMHGLSRSLVIDAASADDLVQDALAAAAGYRGPRPSDPRSWAATILKNLARDRARGRSRRSQRESESARPPSTSTAPSASVEAAERQRVLLDAVLSLDEPYRTVVIMRWFDDLSVRAIAKKSGRPAETIKKQLQRAHAQLREKLESKYGGDGAWAVAILPIAAAETKGLMGAGVVAAAAGMGLAATGVFLSLPGPEQPLTGPDAPTTIEHAKDSGEHVNLQALDGKNSRAPGTTGQVAELTQTNHGPSTELTPSTIAKAAAQGPHFRGRLFDTSGNPITSKSAPGLRLRLAPGIDATGAPTFPGDILIAPDGEGRVESEAAPSTMTNESTISSEGGGLAVLTVGWPDPADDECHIVLMPAVNLGGTVLDSQGDPVPGATVILTTSLEALGSYPANLEDHHRSMNAAAFATTSDQNGQFQLMNTPGKDKFLLEASTKDGATGGTRARNTDTPDLVIRVKDWRGHKSAITGRVLDDRGFPLSGEEVHFISEKALSGEDGRFEIPYGQEQWEYVTSKAACRIWTRSKRGFLAAVDVDKERRGPYIMRLPSKMGTIRGVLRDAAGEPIPHAQVCLFDGTRTQTRATPLEMLSSSGASSERHTGRDGRFEIRGLFDREYHLRFIGIDSTLVLDAPGIRPSERENEFVVPEGHYFRDFKGRCVDAMGRPLAGIHVSLRAAKQTPGDGLPRSSDHRERAVTNDAGEFTLERVSRSGLALGFDANLEDSRPGPSFDIAGLDPTGAAPIELTLDCTVHLSQPTGSEVAQVRFMDADRKTINARERIAKGSRFGAAIRPTEDGTYFPCSVSQAARWIQTIDADGNVLAETELDLSPIRLNELTL